MDIGYDHRIVCKCQLLILFDPNIQRKFNEELRNRFNSQIDETTASNNMSEV